jgi:hypothetical protein
MIYKTMQQVNLTRQIKSARMRLQNIWMRVDVIFLKSITIYQGDLNKIAPFHCINKRENTKPKFDFYRKQTTISKRDFQAPSN